MKAKLTLIIALCVLLSFIALPVLAEDPIAMWVSRARLAYVGRSSTGPDAVVGLIHVRDANLQMVAGATVTATWTTPDGEELHQTAVTAFQGIAEFRIWEGRGEYTLCVDGVTKGGWLYNPGLDRNTCPTFLVP